MYDMLGRKIEVGHVLCNGQRIGTRGALRVCVVTGFTPKTILVNMLKLVEYTSREYFWRKTKVSNSDNIFIIGHSAEHITALLQEKGWVHRSEIR